MVGKRITVRQQSFLGYYLGADPELAGNATQSYLSAYPKSTEKSAGTAGPRLLENVVIQSQIAAHKKAVAKSTQITAEWVLKRSAELYQMAIGEKPTVSESIRTTRSKDADGNEVVTDQKISAELCNTNLQAANQILLTIGKNCTVQAFLEKVDVSHTHILEERLNERTKLVTAAAEARKLRLTGGTDAEDAAAKRKRELVD